MDTITYSWHDADGEQTVAFAHVRGTHGTPYPFGEEPGSIPVEVADFFIGVRPVPQRLWDHLFAPESNPALHRGHDLPLENVSWDALRQRGGILERLNASSMAAAVRAQLSPSFAFRLPSETEWEYAARGGPSWPDGFRFSGGDQIDAVAWYDRRHGDHTQPVARKAPNRLGLYDLSGNVWEWCEDTFTPDVHSIPRNGTAFQGSGTERVLRGGCFHNWAVHCTVHKRYEIARHFHDGCIGVRLVVAEDGPGRTGT